MVAAPIVTLGSFILLNFGDWIRSLRKSGPASAMRIMRPVARALEIACGIVWGAGLLLALVCWVVYPVARLYVLGESFAGLRACEKAVYTTVEWTNFWPHAG